jgi:hypothetical protein
VTHTCHAHGCKQPVPPAMFACRAHWLALPKNIRDAVWREYRYGQEDDKQPSLRYMAVQRLAVAHTAFKPYDEQAAYVAAQYTIEALAWREKAIKAGQGDPLEGLLAKLPPVAGAVSA